MAKQTTSAVIGFMWDDRNKCWDVYITAAGRKRVQKLRARTTVELDEDAARRILTAVIREMESWLY